MTATTDRTVTLVMKNGVRTRKMVHLRPTSERRSAAPTAPGTAIPEPVKEVQIMPNQYTYLSLSARFWSRVDMSSDCWTWTGRVDKDGYGRMVYNHRKRGAHRVSWELHNGPIPDGMLVCHHCDNPRASGPIICFLEPQQTIWQTVMRRVGIGPA
jgi:hypothetical protein